MNPDSPQRKRHSVHYQELLHYVDINKEMFAMESNNYSSEQANHTNPQNGAIRTPYSILVTVSVSEAVR